MLVYVINKHGRPLMPTNPRKARLLLKEGKAKVVKYEPFTIQLVYGSSGYTQPTTLGVDAGTKKVGLAVITEQGKVLYTAEVELRQDIKENLATRKMLRRFRRQRKTRYRKPRFLNRKKGAGWLPPSIRSRINAHVKLVKDICNLLPIKEMKVEIGRFDTQALINPEISGKEYQEGPLKSYDSVQEFIKIRDKYTCHYKDLRKDISCSKRLEADHMQPKSRGGTDRLDNLVCTCSNHNLAKGNMSYEEFTGKRILKVRSFKETVFMNVLKNYLVPLLVKLKPTTYTYGYLTSWKKREFGLEKSHINDAIAITDIKPKEYIGNSYLIKQVRKKKRSLHQMTPSKGFPSRREMNTKKRIVSSFEWCLRDKVSVQGVIGFITGFSGGGFNVFAIEGYQLKISEKKNKIVTPKHTVFICRNNNWISVLV